MQKTKPNSLFVIIIGLLAAFYLINPTAGIFEFIPDNFPFVGNLDEGAASLLVLSALSYFGIDLRMFVSKKRF
jgi:hypothetical protein